MKVGIIVKGKIVEVFDTERKAAEELNVTEGQIRRSIWKGVRTKGYNLVPIEEKET